MNKYYDQAVTYCQKIRNRFKQEYAFAYLRAQVNGLPEPERPAELSYLAAQAVRLMILDILRGRG